MPTPQTIAAQLLQALRDGYPTQPAVWPLASPDDLTQYGIDGSLDFVWLVTFILQCAHVPVTPQDVDALPPTL